MRVKDVSRMDQQTTAAEERLRRLGLAPSEPQDLISNRILAVWIELWRAEDDAPNVAPDDFPGLRTPGIR